jgi:hypothetical protein
MQPSSCITIYIDCKHHQTNSNIQSNPVLEATTAATSYAFAQISTMLASLWLTNAAKQLGVQHENVSTMCPHTNITQHTAQHTADVYHHTCLSAKSLPVTPRKNKKGIFI